MRKQLLKTLATISFLIAIAIVPAQYAQGQTLAYRLRVSIPFDFIVADKEFPAGEYLISRTWQYASDDLITISSVDGRTLAVRLTSTVRALNPKSKGAVVFHHYGN